MSDPTLALVTAGLSVPSSTRLLADRLSGAAAQALGVDRQEPVIEVVELRELARDLADRLVTGFAAPALQTAIDTVVGADALIAVTPVFAGSYSGLFKTFCDVLDEDPLDGVPTLIAASPVTPRPCGG